MWLCFIVDGALPRARALPVAKTFARPSRAVLKPQSMRFSRDHNWLVFYWHHIVICVYG